MKQVWRFHGYFLSCTRERFGDLTSRDVAASSFDAAVSFARANFTAFDIERVQKISDDVTFVTELSDLTRAVQS